MVKNCFTISLLFIVCLLSTAVYAQNDLGAKFKLLPVPKKAELLKGAGIPYSTITSFKVEGAAAKPVLNKSLGNLKEVSTQGKGTVVLKIDSAEMSASPEGYVLVVNNGYVTITGGSQAGLFYGTQTLSQLIDDARDQNIPIPALKITDYPDISYRSIHLDLKHHLDSLSYYYDMMDRLADVKINAVIIEFEDKLKYEQSPIVGASHAISIENFRKLSDYAHERNIEISPLVQGLGHASFILKHPEYKELRDDSTSDWSFDPLNPATYELQFSLYSDAIKATPYGRYLHVGGDEVGKLGMSDRAKKSGKSSIELQMYWLTKVCEFAKEHGRIPIFWDDMIFKLSNLYETTYDPSIPQAEVEKRWKENEALLNEKINLFPKTCVYMRWSYDHPTLPGNKKALAWYKKNGLASMAATSGHQIWPMMPRESSNFQPIKDFAKITAEEKMEGIFLTLWDDTSPHFETLWRGIYDVALFSWNYVDYSKEKAHSLFRHRFYGPKIADEHYAFQDRLEKTAGFWETALIDKGDREVYPKSIDTLDLPLDDHPGAWSQKNAAKIAGARKQVQEYNITRQKLEKALQNAKRNQYALEIFKQLNELQVYPAYLLLKLYAYDNATGGARSKAAKDVLDYSNSFKAIRQSYEQTASRTRILQNPDDYVSDQNHHHHLANGTNTSDWMYVYELALNDSIQKKFAN